MVIAPKDQITLTFFEETKEFADGSKANITEITPEDRNVKRAS